MSEADFTVTIVDDDPSIRKSVSRILQSVGWKATAFASASEFLDAYDPRQSGCLIIDLSMPGLNGLELQQVLRKRGATPPIMFLSGTGDIPDSVRAMKQGALDFLIKPIDESGLLQAVQRALEQERADRQARMELVDLQNRLQTLTRREREVFEHVVSGQLNKQIAADLGTVVSTIKVHRARVMEKMHAESLAELVQFAQRLGIEKASVH